MVYGQADSLNRAFLTVEGDTEAEQKLRQQYQNYLSQSQLMHYDADTQTLFSHAPITKTCLDKLLECMKSNDYNKIQSINEVDSPEKVAEFVSEANRLYPHLLHHAVKNQCISYNIHNLLEGDEDAPGFLWVRNNLKQVDSLPFYGQGVKCLVHGHDNRSEHSSFHWGADGPNPTYAVLNLDQQVRKGNQSRGDCKLLVKP